MRGLKGIARPPSLKLFKLVLTSLLTIASFMTGYMLGSKDKWMSPIKWIMQLPTFDTVDRLVENLTLWNSKENEQLLKLLVAYRQNVHLPVRHGQITIEFSGGTGNQMFEYSALIGAAMMNNLVPYISKEGGSLHEVFTLGEPTLYEEYSTYFTTLTEIAETKPCAYNDSVERLNLNGARILLKGYRQSWKYFTKYTKTIRHHFTFKSEILKEATGVFNGLKGPKKGVTLIAVHVRRGDILNDNKKNYGYLVPDEEYFHRSMSYFRNKYKNVLFVVCSNGMDWAKSALHAVNDDIRFVGMSPEVDLAIMSRCDHVIMSVGSFGWWAGWLAGGEVIYYKTPARAGSALDLEFSYNDYYPSNWLAM